MDEYVYLLSMTHSGSVVYVRDDDSAIAITSHMGSAKAFDSEYSARDFQISGATSFQITPIARKRYFKSKLEGNPILKRYGIQ